MGVVFVDQQLDGAWCHDRLWIWLYSVSASIPGSIYIGSPAPSRFVMVCTASSYQTHPYQRGGSSMRKRSLQWRGYIWARYGSAVKRWSSGKCGSHFLIPKFGSLLLWWVSPPNSAPLCYFPDAVIRCSIHCQWCCVRLWTLDHGYLQLDHPLSRRYGKCRLVQCASSRYCWLATWACYLPVIAGWSCGFEGCGLGMPRV